MALRRILVVEDEASIADNIVYALKSDGFDPVWCRTCADARVALAEGGVALVVLDVGLPDGSGFDLCKEIRKGSRVPLVFVTARSSEVDRVVGLEIGGDDYVVKPFSPRELAARVKAVLRRSEAPTPPAELEAVTRAGAFEVDEGRCRITYHGRVLELTRNEYRLLRTLLARPGQVFSRKQLMDLAWDEPGVSLERTVDSHVKTLRAKLHAVCPGEEPIVTHRGLGYSAREAGPR